MLRIADIARKANVSAATVSRAINQPGIVAPGRLKHIHSVMRELDYEPPPPEHRRGPKRHQAEVRKIGVWFSGGRAGDPNFDWFRNELNKAQERNPRYRIDLTMLFSSGARELPREIREKSFDGIIIQGEEPAPEIVARISSTPCVWFMTRRSTSFRGDYIEPDNEANGRMGADYLRSLGYTNVAAITIEPDYSAIARRVRAFKEHALELGLAVHCVLGVSHDTKFLTTPPTPSEIATLVKRYLAVKPPAGGLYIPSDYYCGMIFRALREAGRLPGRDYNAILGHYTPELYHNLDHSPAFIDINLPTLVNKLVDHLLWRIENPGAIGRIGLMVSPTLVPRPQGG